MADPINGTINDDELLGTSASEEINGLEGHDLIDGAGGNDTVDAGDGDDTVVINSGIDTAEGGLGDDTLEIDYSLVNIGALTIDLRNLWTGGIGTVQNGATVGNLTGFEVLGALNGSQAADTVYVGNTTTGFDIHLNAGNDKFYGGTGADTVYGDAGTDTLVGGGGIDSLYGGADGDSLSGGAGADFLYGGTGNDIYYVDNTLETVTEVDNAANGGIDEVRSTRTFTLSTFVEKLTLVGTTEIDGTGNTLANVIRGNEAANVLTGLAGDDTLFGYAGNDSLYGGGNNDSLDGGVGADFMAGSVGSDIYFVDDIDDVVSELGSTGADAGGVDTIKTSVTFTMSAYVEKLSMLGSADIDAQGNGGSNTMVGNGGANELYGRGNGDTILGGAGNDVLSGGLGSDVLTGGTGADLFHFDVLETSANKDTLKDFVSGTDAIGFDRAVFTAFAAFDPGFALTADNFVNGAATTADHHVLYNASTGVVSYDADGNGAGAAVQIAVVVGKPVLDHTDFYLI